MSTVFNLQDLKHLFTFHCCWNFAKLTKSCTLNTVNTSVHVFSKNLQYFILNCALKQFHCWSVLTYQLCSSCIVNRHLWF